MTAEVTNASATDRLGEVARHGLPLLVPGIILVMVLLLIIGPMAAMLLEAFVSENSSLERIVTPLIKPAYWEALLNTIVISVGTAVLATVIGTVLAWVLVRTDTVGGPILEKVCQIPIFVPPFIGAIAWTLLAAPNMGIINKTLAMLGTDFTFDVYTLPGMIWVIGLYLAPYVMLIVSAALRSMDPSLEEAAQISGMSKIKTAMRITAPVLAPSIASGMGIAFAISLGLFGTPMVLGWSRQILTLTGRIYMASQEFPAAYDLMAVCSIYLLLLSSVAVFMQKRFLGDRKFITVTGKAFRPRKIELGAVRWATFSLAILFIVVTIVAPVAVLVAASISTFTWSGIYDVSLLSQRLLNTDVIQSTTNSLRLAVWAASFSVGLAILLSWIFVRTQTRGCGLLEYIVLTPISIPGITFGVGVFLMWIYLPLPVYGTSLIIIFAFIGQFTAYAVRSIMASLAQIHPELEESARLCGYGPVRTFLSVTAPLIMPSMVASWVLVFSFCMIELSMVLLLYTSENRTLSVLVFEVWQVGDFSYLATVSLLQVTIGMVFMTISKIVTRNSGMRT